MRVARLYLELPQILDELKSGAIHLTGLFLLSGHLTEDNADSLLAEARGKTRRELELVIARWFPGLMSWPASRRSGRNPLALG